MSDTRARRRWMAIGAVRIAAPVAALLGIVLVGRSTQTIDRVLGIAIVLAAFFVLFTVPRGLARRWRTPHP